jgi:DNA replication protein DnaC
METMETNNKTAPITREEGRNTISLNLVNRMKLHGMAIAFGESLQPTVAGAMTADSFVPMLPAREWDYRSNAAIQRLVRQAGFRYKAFPGEIGYTISRGPERNQMERTAPLGFIRQGQNLFITGSSGTAKGYTATALGCQALQRGNTDQLCQRFQAGGALKVAKAKGTIEPEPKKIERCQLPIPDDLFPVPLDAKERAILQDIIGDRHERKYITVASQLPVAGWYDAMGGPAVADAILGRIVHSAQQVELTGGSVRKVKVGKNK